MKRELRTRFSDIRPFLGQKMDVEKFDKNSKCVSRFLVEEKVFVKNLHNGPRWLPRIVTEVLQHAYVVQVSQNVWKRHEKHLCFLHVEILHLRRSPYLLLQIRTDSMVVRASCCRMKP